MDLGVIQRFSNIEHPWENGIAERSFQTLFSLARSLLKYADLPDRLWGKAILHSVYITNRSPSAALGGIAPLVNLYKNIFIYIYKYATVSTGYDTKH